MDIRRGYALVTCTNPPKQARFSYREIFLTGFYFIKLCQVTYLRHKSWKRRYFDLLKKIKTTCHLKYFKREEIKKNELLGTNDLSVYSTFLTQTS